MESKITMASKYGIRVFQWTVLCINLSLGMDDERVLSPVISKAMGSKRTPGYVGVVKVRREPVTSLLQHKESSKYTATSSAKKHIKHANFHQDSITL